MGVANLPQSAPQTSAFFRPQNAGLLSFVFEHGTVNCLTPASQPAVGNWLLAALSGAPHGFFGIEGAVVKAIADWIKGH